MFFSLKRITLQQAVLQSRRYDREGSGSLKRPLLAARYDRQRQPSVGESTRHGGYRPPKVAGLTISTGYTKEELKRKKRVQARDDGSSVSSIEDWPLSEPLSPLGVAERYVGDAPQLSEFIEAQKLMHEPMAAELMSAACELRVLGMHYQETGGIKPDVTYRERTALAKSMGFVGDEARAVLESKSTDHWVVLKEHHRLMPIIHMMLRHRWYHELSPEVGGEPDTRHWAEQKTLNPNEFELRYVPKEYKETYTRREERETGWIFKNSEEVDVGYAEVVPAGLQLVRKTAAGQPDDIICFNRRTHLQSLFEKRDADLLEEMGRLASVAEACSEIISPPESDMMTAQYRRAMHLWNMGCDFEAADCQLYKKTPDIVGMQKPVRPMFSGLDAPAEAKVGELEQTQSAREFRGEVSAGGIYIPAILGDAVEGASTLAYEVEMRLSTSQAADLHQQRAKRFEAIAALSAELHAKLTQANRMLVLLNKLTKAIADAKINIARDDTIKQASVDWRGVKAVWNRMHAERLVPNRCAHDTDFSQLNVSKCFSDLKEMIAAAQANHNTLYGSPAEDGVLVHWGICPQAKERSATSLVLVRDAKTQLKERVQTHMVEPNPSRRVISLADLTGEKKRRLVVEACVRVRAMRSGSRPETEAKAGAPERRRGRPSDAGRATEVVGWRDNKNQFEPYVMDRSRSYERDERRLKQAKDIIFESKAVRALKVRMDNLVAGYDKMVAKLRDKRPSQLTHSEIRLMNYHILGRAKAQTLQNYYKDLANARSVEQFFNVYDQLDGHLPDLCFSVHLLQQDGRFTDGTVVVHVDQHRHGDFDMGDGQAIESRSDCFMSGMFGGRGQLKTTSKLAASLVDARSDLQPLRPKAAVAVVVM